MVVVVVLSVFVYSSPTVFKDKVLLTYARPNPRREDIHVSCKDAHNYC